MARGGTTTARGSRATGGTATVTGSTTMATGGTTMATGGTTMATSGRMTVSGSSATGGTTTGRYLDIHLCSIPTVGVYEKQGNLHLTHSTSYYLLYYSTVNEVNAVFDSDHMIR